MVATLGTSSSAFAATPTAIYGKVDGKDMRFSFTDVLAAYSDENTTYQTLWLNAQKYALVYDNDRALTFDGLIEAIADNPDVTPSTYGELSNAPQAVLPANVIKVGHDGNTGNPEPNPDTNNTDDSLEVIGIE